MLYIVVIILICLLYIHIKYYIDYAKTEQIYELSNIATLDKITYLKHPVTFTYAINKVYSLQKINVVDISNNYNEIVLKHKKAKKLLKLSNYYSQYNKITNKLNDTLFKPITTIQSEYDILFGPKDITTRLSSEYAYRTILVVIDGNIDITLIHPKYSHMLNEQLNCKHLIRESGYNIWNKSTPNHNTLHLKKGTALSIPMYWWWSIKFGPQAIVYKFKYYPFMNQIVILPILAQIWLNN